MNQAKGKVYEILYNKKEDKFWISDSSRSVIQAIE